ncbi:hypothetical protein D3C73_1049080 [compost metagenome]
MDVIEHLGWRLAARRVEKLVGQPIDRALLAGFLDDVGRRDQGDRASRSRGPQPCAQLARFVRRQQVAVHVTGPAAHGGTGHHVLGNGVLQEAFGGIDLDLACLDILLVDHTTNTAVMVDVTVGVDHCDHGFLRPMLIVKVECGLGSFRRNQRVKDGDAFLALDDGHVRQVVVAHLIDAIGDFEQAGNIDQL